MDAATRLAAADGDDRLEQRFIREARERLGPEAAAAAGRELNAQDALAYALAEPAVASC